jgi:hypothetical protein
MIKNKNILIQTFRNIIIFNKIMSKIIMKVVVLIKIVI